MRPLERHDTLLLAILTPLWLLALGLHLRTVSTTQFAEPPVFVSAPRAADDGYPCVTGFYVGREHGAPELRVGDRLLQLADLDLRGLGHVGFEAYLRELGAGTLRVPVRFERDGEIQESVIRLLPARIAWNRVPHLLALGVTCLVIMLRAPTRRRARGFFVPWMLFTIVSAQFAGGPAWQTYLWKYAQFILGMLVPPLMIGWCLDFPEERRRPGRWDRLWPWLFAPVNGVLRGSYFLGGPVPPQLISSGIAAFDGTVGGLCLLIVTLNYRHADPIGRRRIKWVLYGVYLGTLPIVVTFTLAALQIATQWHSLLFAFSFVVSVSNSLGVLIAIVRYQLYDIDRLISATASYSLLAVAMLACVLSVTPRIADGLSMVIGLDPVRGQTALALLLAAVLVPLQRHLRPRVDRVFFPERYSIDRAIEALLRDLAHCETPEVLLKQTGEQVATLLRPETCAIYARAGESYEALFAQGRAIPPAFDAESPLISTLRLQVAPMVAERWTTARESAALGSFDLAALETLDVAVMVPIRRHDDLFAFVCLGPKSSGDMYVAADLALLATLGDRIAAELVRWGEMQLNREVVRMQEELRRYVPGAVVRSLEEGLDLEPRECAVSVLFVDIRGYTSYSEGRGPAEIFSTVNRYAQAVSTIVKKQGGNVVEFNGDGMMAVFGAPQLLPNKERAALITAREIVSSVHSMRGSRGGAEPPVGIGIATGLAIVGSIQSADRLLWTALGNTTNLAARLQSLSRELDAAVVIDVPTWRAAGDEAEGFVRHEDIAIRGREEREDLYLLPLEA